MTVSNYLNSCAVLFSKQKRRFRPGFRHLFIAAAAVLTACSSTGHSFNAQLHQPPQDIRVRVLDELKALGYSADDSTGVAGARESNGAVVITLRGQRAAGPDLDARGFLYEVLRVTLLPAANGTDTEINVRAGTESISFLGVRRRVPSRPQVRNDAAELLNRLRQKQE